MKDAQIHIRVSSELKEQVGRIVGPERLSAIVRDALERLVKDSKEPIVSTQVKKVSTRKVIKDKRDLEVPSKGKAVKRLPGCKSHGSQKVHDAGQCQCYEAKSSS